MEFNTCFNFFKSKQRKFEMGRKFLHTLKPIVFNYSLILKKVLFVAKNAVTLQLEIN